MPAFDATLDELTFFREHDGEFLHFLEDHEFDYVYPEHIQGLSRCQWTPVEVCRKAALLLAPHPDTHVLDVGCGPGKFCAIGATTTGARFTGVEQRENLARTARRMLRQYNIDRVEIIHANITEVSFSAFDAVYLFNPFQENIFPALRIDFEVELKPTLYQHYNSYVKGQLEQMPEGTRVVTYCSNCEEIPECYEWKETAVGGNLRLWIKTGGQPPVTELAEADPAAVQSVAGDARTLSLT